MKSYRQSMATERREPLFSKVKLLDSSSNPKFCPKHRYMRATLNGLIDMCMTIVIMEEEVMNLRGSWRTHGKLDGEKGG